MSVTLIIVVLTVIVSIMAINDNDLKYKLTFSPYSVKHHNRWWLVFTHGLIHADYAHLSMNMFTLYFLGQGLEGKMIDLFGIKGQFYYVLLYLGGLVFATIPSFYKHSDNPGYLSLGASGAVSSVVFGFILLLPLTPLMMMFIPIPIPGYIFGIGFLVFESYANRKARTNIAHDAHLAGAVFGALFLIVIDPSILVDFFHKVSSAFR
ncbi:MAG: rhomboid family intramembrane serine protease [Flavobacteriales bacterium]|nr:rhomboid family intramembrane serine protease [Flavobacteriales bacterium]